MLIDRRGLLGVGSTRENKSSGSPKILLEKELDGKEIRLWVPFDLEKVVRASISGREDSRFPMENG